MDTKSWLFNQRGIDLCWLKWCTQLSAGSAWAFSSLRLAHEFAVNTSAPSRLFLFSCNMASTGFSNFSSDSGSDVKVARTDWLSASGAELVDAILAPTKSQYWSPYPPDCRSCILRASHSGLFIISRKVAFVSTWSPISMRMSTAFSFSFFQAVSVQHSSLNSLRRLNTSLQAITLIRGSNSDEWLNRISFLAGVTLGTTKLPLRKSQWYPFPSSFWELLSLAITATSFKKARVGTRLSRSLAIWVPAMALSRVERRTPVFYLPPTCGNQP